MDQGKVWNQLGSKIKFWYICKEPRLPNQNCFKYMWENKICCGKLFQSIPQFLNYIFQYRSPNWNLLCHFAILWRVL
uniref:Uncharacterized protein n=1 Tax=Rhizophora mucronata TaxID=61149 RepID=A0A2P2MYT0_RHIMU